MAVVVAVDVVVARICALGTSRRPALVGYAARLPEATRCGTQNAVPTSFIVKAKGLKVCYMTRRRVGMSPYCGEKTCAMIQCVFHTRRMCVLSTV